VVLPLLETITFDQFLTQTTCVTLPEHAQNAPLLRSVFCKWPTGIHFHLHQERRRGDVWQCIIFQSNPKLPLPLGPALPLGGRGATCWFPRNASVPMVVFLYRFCCVAMFIFLTSRTVRHCSQSSCTHYWPCPIPLLRPENLPSRQCCVPPPFYEGACAGCHPDFCLFASCASHHEHLRMSAFSMKPPGNHPGVSPSQSPTLDHHCFTPGSMRPHSDNTVLCCRDCRAGLS